MSKIPVGIVGITSITARYLLGVLSKHSGVVPVLFASESAKELKMKQVEFIDDGYVESIGEDLLEKEIYPVFDQSFYEKCCNKVDLLFLCLSNTISMKFFLEIFEYSKKNNIQMPKIIDLSGDFRIKNADIYTRYYKEKHIASNFLDKFVYGLPEINKEKIKNTFLVANPGCYPTTVILGLAPIIGFAKQIIVDSKSGYSGGGKKLVKEYETRYNKNNTYAYGVDGSHRHIPEIEEQLYILSGSQKNFIFTPHVVPQFRGMFSDIYVELDKKLNLDEVHNLYTNFYRNEPFVKILDINVLPQTLNVHNTNYCEIGFASQEKFSSWLKIFVAIDNLIKGAVGNAVQNMNLVFGYEETKGLL